MSTTTDEDREARFEVIRTYWKVLMAGDMVGFRALLAPDAIIHYPGQHYLSGDYTTNDDIVGLYTKLTQFIKDGVFVGRVLDITAGAKYTSVVIEYDLHMPIKTLHGRAIGLFDLRDGKIHEYWLHEWNQHMINWVFRSSRWFGWATRFLPKRKQR
jgi:ketosteroid isomerase-like protein